MFLSRYVKCRAFEKGQEVLQELPVQNVASWNALISGYVQSGHVEQARKFFEQMFCQGVSPSPVTFCCILKACNSKESVDRVHFQVIQLEFLVKDVILGTALVNAYTKCGALEAAYHVLDELPERNVVSWNALITGYAQEGQLDEALNCFRHMQHEGLSPSSITFLCLLKACGSTAEGDLCEQIHAKLVSCDLMEKNKALGNALVAAYAKCGMLAKARKVLDELPARDVVSWTALISGYTDHSHGMEALNCFHQMKLESVTPNAVTFVCIFHALGSLREIGKGKEIHAEIMRLDLLEKNVVVGNALMDMYVKCGLLWKAQKMLMELPIHDAVSWSILIAGYMQHGLGEKALNCYDKMKQDGFSPNVPTLCCLLTACGTIGSIDKGEQIQVDIVRQGLLKKHLVLGNALVDMYAKCGLIVKAKQALDQLHISNIVAWTALIAGYAQHAHGEEAIACLAYMHQEGVSSDAAIFTCLLNACRNSGLLDKGKMLFMDIVVSEGILLDPAHYVCMVDLFSQVGHLDKALVVILEMPYFDHLAVWGSLLAGCQVWGNVKLGRLAFEHSVQLDKRCAGAYVSMSNIYAAADMHDEAKNIAFIQSKGEVCENL